MKFLLIASALNLELVYNDKDTCKLAAEEIMRANNDSVICIPLGEDAGELRMRNFINNFVNMIRTVENE